MTGDKETFNFDAVKVENLTVMQQYLFVVDRDLRQRVKVIDYLAMYLSCQVAILYFSYLQLCLFEQSRTVGFHCADMVSILMRDEDLSNGFRVNSKPTHFFGKAVIIIPRIDHNGRITLAIEKDVCHPFSHAGYILVDPSGVQRLEDFLAAVHLAHCLSLKFGCFL